jgi:hypothetical protein
MLGDLRKFVTVHGLGASSTRKNLHRFRAIRSHRPFTKILPGSHCCYLLNQPDLCQRVPSRRSSANCVCASLEITRVVSSERKKKQALPQRAFFTYN